MNLTSCRRRIIKFKYLRIHYFALRLRYNLILCVAAATLSANDMQEEKRCHDDMSLCVCVALQLLNILNDPS